MDYKTIEIFLIVFALLYVVFEVVLNVIGNDEDTTNVFLNKWSRGEFLFIPFALGAICGHLFLGVYKNPFPNDIFSWISNEMLAVALLALVSILLWLLGKFSSFQRTNTIISIILLSGLAYGHFFWSMRHP